MIARKQELWVRCNPLSTDKALPDIAAIAGGAPDGILLPKTTSATDVVTLDHYLSALEAREGVALGSIRIMAVATETPIALFTLGTFAGCSPRLAGMTWGAEDLSSALGAATNRDTEGNLEFTYRLARSLCLAAAVAANVQPIDTVFTDFRDSEGLRKGIARGVARGLYRQDRDSSGSGAGHQRCVHADRRGHRVCEAGDRGIRSRARGPSGSTARCWTCRI